MMALSLSTIEALNQKIQELELDIADAEAYSDSLQRSIDRLNDEVKYQGKIMSRAFRSLGILLIVNIIVIIVLLTL